MSIIEVTAESRVREKRSLDDLPESAFPKLAVAEKRPGDRSQTPLCKRIAQKPNRPPPQPLSVSAGLNVRRDSFHPSGEWIERAHVNVETARKDRKHVLKVLRWPDMGRFAVYLPRHNPHGNVPGQRDHRMSFY